MVNTKHSSNPKPSSRSLITSISARDNLPNDWNETKKKRHSADHSGSLQTHLEKRYDIDQSSQPPTRSLSASSESNPFRQTYSGHLKSHARRMLENSGGYFLSSLKIFTAYLRSARTIIPTRPDHTKLQRDTLEKTASARVLLYHFFWESLYFLAEVLSYFSGIFGRCWSILKKPLAIITALMLTWIILLNIFATLYTVTHESFLNTFCPTKLPIVRNMLCIGWDQRQTQRNANRHSSSNFSAPFTAYFKNEDKSLSYLLPDYLNYLESSMRSFRASLPEFEYSSEEQELFYQELSTYIGQSDITIRNSQEFYAHITGTIHLHISDTSRLVQELNRTGFSSSIRLQVDGSLAQSMAFFNSYGMVYLIGGLEPFKRDISGTINVQAIEFMHAHMSALSERLREDIYIITSLQQSLGYLGGISSAIEQHVSRCVTENNKDLLRRSVWTGLAEKLRQTIPGYQMEQRGLWLGDIQPVIKHVSRFLNEVASELNAARLFCQNFKEDIEREATAAIAGWEPADWIDKHGKKLVEGIKALESELTIFGKEKLEFNENIFTQRRKAADRDLGVESFI